MKGRKNMTREERKYWRRSRIYAVLCVAVCTGILYGASLLANAVM